MARLKNTHVTARARLSASALAAALVALAAFPMLAHAGTARISSTSIVFDAFPGEANDVTIVKESNTRVRLRDAGAPVTPGTSCVAIDANEVRCTYTGAVRRVPTGLGTNFRLGDMNDRASGADNVQGGEGDDTITNPPLDPRFAESGFLLAAFGNPLGVHGGPGNDTIVGYGDGDEGNDVLRAPAGSPSILFGGLGDDRLEGGSEDDFFRGGFGADHVISGGGRDTISFADGHTVPVVFSMETTPQGGRAGEGDTYDGAFANVIGDRPSGRIVGSGIGNELTGNGELVGLAGDDTLDGGTGNDRLDGGTGDDLLREGDLDGNTNTLDGGDGDDTIDAFDLAEETEDTAAREMAPTADTIVCGAGKDRANVDTADVVPDTCEIVATLTPLGSTIIGTEVNDLIIGFSDDGDEDRIFGDDGDDTIHGRSGNDSLLGQNGDDRIEGDDDNDGIQGGNGADHLIGGRGADRITGGAGRDRISAGDGSDAVSARDGRADKVRCGRGRDRLTADRSDRVSRDCERVSRR